MEFVDLKAQFHAQSFRIRERIDAVLEHGRFIMGPEVQELECALANFTGARHCITCSSGTSALVMPLMAWGVGPGDAVFVPPFSFFATGEAPARLGATPVMVDIDPLTFNMDPDGLEKAVTAVFMRDPSLYPIPKVARQQNLRPRVVLPVDLFGQPANYSALLPLAAKHDLLVLEDAAQSFGAAHQGKRACALGCHAAATSFFPAKPLGCYGDGGAVFTDDDATADVLRSIRIHGQGNGKYDNVRIGFNGRMDTLQAAILLAKLEIFHGELAARQKIAEWYTESLSNIPGVRLLPMPIGIKSSWAQFTIVVESNTRDAVAANLKEQGIPTNIYYPVPMHMLAAFSGLGYAPEDMPVALAASKSVLSLPFHPYLTEADTTMISTAIKKALP